MGCKIWAQLADRAGSSTPEIEQELKRVFGSISEADDGLRRLYRATNSHLLQNYNPPALHKSIELWAFPFNTRFNYSAAPRALKLCQTVYSLKTRRRSFHTFTRPLFLNGATVYLQKKQHTCQLETTVCALRSRVLCNSTPAVILPLRPFKLNSPFTQKARSPHDRLSCV